MNAEEEFYKDKYPDGYINHYLAMYSANQHGLSSSNFETQNNLYIECEGKEEFLNLRNEVGEAKRKEDLDWFLKLARAFEITEIDIDSLNRMFESIEKFRKV